MKPNSLPFHLWLTEAVQFQLLEPQALQLLSLQTLLKQGIHSLVGFLMLNSRAPTFFQQCQVITSRFTKWEEVIVLYTITFQTNGGNSITAYKAASMTTIVKPTDPIKVGFTFSGWFNDAELLAPYVFSTMPAKDFTLYAKWTPITYTFETNGGSTTSNIVAPYLSVITAPTPPTKAGYTFIGWFNESGLLMPYVFFYHASKKILLYMRNGHLLPIHYLLNPMEDLWLLI